MRYKREYRQGGFKFEWNGHHTVNVWLSGVNIDCFTVGDMAQDYATEQDVRRGIRNWLIMKEAE